MNGFDRLKNLQAKSKQPMRVKVVEVTRGSTLQAFLNKYPVGDITTETLAIINGMQLTDTVKRGDKVKVLR